MKKLLGFLVGATLTVTGVTGGILNGAEMVAALDAEMYIKAEEPIYLGFGDRFLMTELKMSGDPKQEYIKIELNDSKYMRKNINTLAIDRTNGAMWISSITSMGIWPIDFDAPIMASPEKFDFFRHMGNEMASRLLFRFNIVAPANGSDAGGSGIMIRYIDFGNCVANWEEGMLCVLDREEDNRLYYEASWDGFGGQKVIGEESNERGSGEGEGSKNIGEGDGGERDGDREDDGKGGAEIDDKNTTDEVTTAEDKPAIEETQKSKRQVARTFAVVKNNNTDDDATGTEGEVLGSQDETEYEEDEEPGVPLAGQSGVELHGVWVFWLVGLVVVAWLILIVFKRRKERENKKAVANIVAETRK